MKLSVYLAMGLLALSTTAYAADRALLTPGSEAVAATTLQPLARAAAAQGSVNVIVGYRVPFAPEGELAPSARSLQASQISAAAASLRSRYSAAIARHPASYSAYASIPFMALEVNAEELARLAADPQVLSITENHQAKPLLAQSVPLVGGDKAWAAGFSGAGQTVAIIDTGVEGSHPFLAGKVVSEACYSRGGLCPGGATSSTAPGSGAPCTLDLCEHGTHVAGIAAGAATPEFAASGVAKDARIIAIKVASPDKDIPVLPTIWESDIIAGLERVYALRKDYPIAAVNMSIGWGKYRRACDGSAPAFAAAIRNLKSAGIASVVATGNNGYTDAIAFPSCLSDVISVGAISDRVQPDEDCEGFLRGPDQVDCYSNSSRRLLLLAPGSSIESSVPGGGFMVMQGTSMAAPHVAGAVAVIRQKAPRASVSEILSALQATGSPVKDRRNSITRPRIDVKAALDFFHSVTIGAGDNKGGTVSISAGGRTSTCTAAACTEVYSRGTALTLSARPAKGYIFTGWSIAACKSKRSCTVVIREDTAVSASFSPRSASAARP